WVDLEPVARIRREAGRRAFLAEDDVRRALVAPGDAHRVLDAVEPHHPRTLDRGLDVILRQDRPGCRRTVQVEPAALERRLHGGGLPAGELLRLRRAAGRDRHDTRGELPWVRHRSPPSWR